MQLYDITLPLSADLAVWPGDTPYAFELTCRRGEAGAPANVGAVRTTVHAGTHADAPFHCDDAGATVERLPLEAFLGPAVVIDVRGRDPIGPEDLRELDLAETPRVLLRTGAWPDPRRFPGAIPALAPELPAFLAERGVVLLGVDVPSVDALDSDTLPNHHALARHGIQILESLRLDAVPEGHYELIALPLRLEGADGSPVRAVLRGA
jgi:arylformamidase